jgi:hypothetical protein
MKKLLLSLLVLACVAPAMAATITFGTPDTGTPGQVTIPWTADAGVVGMGLTVTASAGQVDSFTVDSFFDIFIDLAFENPSGYEYGDGAGANNQNGADQDAPGVVPLPSNRFSISVGGLGGETLPLATPPTSGAIVLKSAAGATIAVCEDTLRGGVVGYDGAMTIVGLCKNIVIGPAVTECYAGMANYAEWVDAGKPECWCYARQCRGDADGKKVGSAFTGFYYVSQDDLNILIGAWQVKNPPQGPGLSGTQGCADFNRAKVGSAFTGYYRVSQDDLNILIGTWQVKEAPQGPGVPGDCLPGNKVPL